jgi:type I restriction-modification system DNA methylase subunit
MPQDARPFRNSNLFSNHYLEKLVKESPQWRKAEPEEAFASINELFQRKARALENYNESQLEENFIRPVLRILGHYFGVQGKVAGKDRTPDYAIFPDQESQDQAEAHPGEDYYRRAVAVGDAKSWKIPLDKSRKGQGSFEMQNPSYQIDVYLRDTAPKWAILTSGRFWRLYHETTSYKLDYYYEVDLPALLERGDLDCFKYFYLFFRREAFGQTVDGGCFLDSVREESVAYAQEIGEDLKENVYRAMKILAQGFLAEAAAGAAAPSQEAVARVQENSMRLLYRLLFIFYAESRSLLDINNRYYYELSLQKLKADVAERLDRSEPLLSVRYSYWESLKNLFSLINDGSESRRIAREEFYIPAYNGGLFDPAKNEFLESARIGDSFLARALDLLARSGAGQKAGFVDYSSLEIRHLGSIYEGLLEYRLRVAEQPMAAVKEKGKELWLPTGEAGKRKILDRAAAGEIYLATDKGERKATGSYYTPDYIVKYIVKNTIEPVIEKKKQEWLGTSRPFADYVLSIKVLDPAMGSGHFLVEATDQLARWLVSAWATARPEEADSKEIAEQDIHWARREVVRNCIYGVDLNPMAVELAKLSLWLTTVASNKPLSFLDHHLRCGNSLIGAELDRLTVLPGGQAEQTPLWSYGLRSHTDGLLKRYSLMAALPDDNLQMVKWKEDQFRQIKESELSRRLYELSNVWLSTYFGNIVSDDDYYELQNHLHPEKFPDWGGLRAREWFTRAQALGQEKRFFHWELEYPEAFQGENRGFDVVIGNPPYVRVQELSHEDIDYFKSSFDTAYKRVDISILFFEVALKSISKNGIAAYISSIQFLTTEYGRQLRKLLLMNQIKSMLDFKDLPVFDEATTYPGIVIISSGKPTPFEYHEIVKLPSNKHDQLYLEEGFKIDPASLNDNSWQLVDYGLKKILDKICDEIISVKLSSLAETRGGVITGKDDIFNLDQSKIDEWNIEREILLPLVRGPDVDRYYTIPSMYILYPYEQIQNEGTRLLSESKLKKLFPNAYSYLKSHEEELRERKDSRRSVGNSNEWYKLIRYGSNHLFQSRKILTPGESIRNSFAVDCTGSAFSFARVYAVIAKDVNTDFLAAILNSKVLEFLLHSICPLKRGGYYTFSSTYLEDIPIRRISFTTPAPERARLGAELELLYAEGKFTEILAQVDACLPKDGEGNFIASQERSDVVHDLLAHLAERMLEMNKEKQTEIKGFLGWLEGYLGAKVEDLTPKTKLQSYYEHDYEGLMAVLRKNGKKLAVDPARREPAEALRAEFEGSMGKLGPLRERIRQTDELIDATVYRLYGLTQEEIGIVRGETH